MSATAGAATEVPKRPEGKAHKTPTPLPQPGSILAVQFSHAENRLCADCGSRKKVEWASLTYGIFLCQRCASEHRALGIATSFTKSARLDNWTRADVNRIRLGGNRRFKEFLRSQGCKEKTGPGFNHRVRYTSKAFQQYRKLLNTFCETSGLGEEGKDWGLSGSQQGVSSKEHTGPVTAQKHDRDPAIANQKAIRSWSTIMRSLNRKMKRFRVAVKQIKEGKGMLKNKKTTSPTPVLPEEQIVEAGILLKDANTGKLLSAWELNKNVDTF
mmetsp:Transcript_25838/g.62234  ORF Transcript_25838/g.62234 Transcript_25838/m.62234 type:complete len:270 (-) Transcript_25838:35-844(-)